MELHLTEVQYPIRCEVIILTDRSDSADKVCCLAVVELNAFLEHILNGTINN